ncbi:MAG: hypothetical protein KGL52_09005 [Rhodospirillales bacterium]|nr:hypothetical protein [Rhodospirillales bacterium]
MSGSGRQRLFSSFDRPRRRFVQDGEVPVTVIHPRPRQGIDALGPPRPGVSPLERAEKAEAALATERSAREHAERLLRDAQATILDLRTKQGHAELARAEAEDAVAALRLELSAVRTELGAAHASVAAAEEALQASRARPAAPARRRGRPRAGFAFADTAGSEAVEVEAAARAPRIALAPEPAAPSPATQRRTTKTPAVGRRTAKAVTAATGEPDAGIPEPLPNGPEEPARPARRGPGRPRTVKAAPKPIPAAKPVKWWLKPTGRAKVAGKTVAKAATRRRSPRAF